MELTRAITVTLGEFQKHVDARVKSGAYASADDVLRAGLRALDREEAAAEAVLRRKVQEALDDSSEHIPAEGVFADLRAHHTSRLNAARRGS